MSKKPSLFVVERKEVIILSILFVLSIVLTFTVGVKYGEIVGRKAALGEKSAATALQEPKSNAGGTLGENVEGDANHDHAATDAHSSGDSHGNEHGDAHSAAGHDASPDAHAAPANEEHNAGHGAANSEPGKEHESEGVASEEEGAESESSGGGADSVAAEGRIRDSDQELLDALKKSGIERRSDTESGETMEKEESGDLNDSASTGPHFVIQVGSYPTKQDAERHMARLRARKLDPRILPSAETKGGRWFRVALGNFPERELAVQKAQAYKSSGLIKEFFVRKVQ